MSILFFTKGDKYTPSSRSRVWFLAERLGYDFMIIHKSAKGFPETREILKRMRASDVLFIHKSLFPWKVVVLIFVGGLVFRKRLVYDLDDAEWMHSRFKSVLLACLADTVICGSHVILSWAQKHNRDCVFIPTVVDHEIYAQHAISHKKRDCYTVGWVGTGKGHFLDGHFGIIRPALLKLAQSNTFRFVIIGGENYSPLKEYFAGMPFETVVVDTLDWKTSGVVPRAIHEYSFDIGLMPTSNTPFNQAKCAFKAIEYMACGVPVVASPVGENEIVVQGGETGLFAHTEQEWQDTIKALLDDVNIRDRLGREGMKRVHDHYSYAAVLPRYKKILGKIITEKS